MLTILKFPTLQRDTPKSLSKQSLRKQCFFKNCVTVNEANEISTTLKDFLDGNP